MNKLEAAYAEVLKAREIAGEVLWWKFECVTLKLAPDCRYTPDFVVMLADGSIEAHEAKGHWEDHAKVKIRLAAELFPFRFVAVKKEAKKRGGGWSEQEF